VQRKGKSLTVEQAKQKALRYCAYQERSHQEVKNKLYELGLRSFEVDELMAFLITEGFLNEERYAKLFAGGKFRIKHWGRVKITHALETKGVSKNCIRIGLREIDVGDYAATLRKILTDKIEAGEEPNAFVVRDKAAKFAIQKGYEPDLVWQALKELLPG
jgi:regulatory protein